MSGITKIKRLYDSVKKFTAVLADIISVVWALIYLISYVQGNIEHQTVFFLGIGIICICASSIYIYFNKVPAYPLWARRLAMSSMIFSVVIFAIFLGWGYHKNLFSDKIVILVADFDGPEPQNYRVTDTIIEQLRKNTRQYYYVQIKSLDESIKAREGKEIARSKGKDKNANIVLWGWYAKPNQKVLITINFEVLKQPRNLSLNQGTYNLVLSISELESTIIKQELSPDMTSLTLMTVGLVRFETKDYKGAEAIFSRALEVDSAPEGFVNLGDIYFSRGYAYLHIGDCKKAVNDLLLALNYNPGLENAYLNLGGAYLCQGDSESAMEILRKGLELNPESKFNFYLNLGSSCLQESARDFKIGAKERADFEISKDYSDLNLSEQSFHESLLDEECAIDYLERAIDVNPNHESPYVNLGILYKWKAVIENNPDHFNKAIEYFSKAIKINPYNSNAYHSRGTTYAVIGKHTRAINDYSIITIMIEPKNAEAYLLRGLAYTEIGDKNKAKADLQKLLKISKDPEFIQIAEKQLRELAR